MCNTRLLRVILKCKKQLHNPPFKPTRPFHLFVLPVVFLQPPLMGGLPRCRGGERQRWFLGEKQRTDEKGPACLMKQRSPHSDRVLSARGRKAQPERRREAEERTHSPSDYFKPPKSHRSESPSFLSLYLFVTVSLSPSFD